METSGELRGHSTFRAWLYRIATNASLDSLKCHPRRITHGGSGLPQVDTAEVPWLQPYPDRLLDEIVSPDDEPEVAVVAKRARETLKEHLPERRLEWAVRSEPSEEERLLLQRYVNASERGDMAALAALLREDARFTMPPAPEVYRGRDVLIASWAPSMTGRNKMGDFRAIPTHANRQPAAAFHVRRTGDPEYRALSLDVLRIEDQLLAEIITFGSGLFGAFGLPPTLR